MIPQNINTQSLREFTPLSKRGKGERKTKRVFAIVIIGLLCFSMLSMFAPKADATGAPPVGYWKFDEGLGTIAHDSSGNAHDGTVYDATWTNGISGTALSFNGASSYVEVPNSADLNPPQFTVDAWVTFRSLPDPSSYPVGVPHPNMMIVSKGTDDTQFNGYYGLSVCRDPPSSPVVFQFYITTSVALYWARSTTQVEANKWYYVAGTYDGSTLKIYVNGVAEASTSVAGLRTVNPGDIQIGALRKPSFEYWLDGTIDEVKIYNYARTAEEIQNDYASGEQQPRVLLMDGGTGQSFWDYDWSFPNGSKFTVRGFLQSKGFSVDVSSQVLGSNPVTLAVLLNYDVVILSATYFDVPENVPYQGVFEDYANQGGGLLFLGQADVSWVTLDDALGFHFVTIQWWNYYVDAYITDPSHPIMCGITELPKAGGVFVDWDTLIADSPLPPNTAVLARSVGAGGMYDPNNVIALIAFQYGQGKVVAGPLDGMMRPYGPTAVDGYDVVSEPVIENKLLINAIRWVARMTQPQRGSIAGEITGLSSLPFRSEKVIVQAFDVAGSPHHKMKGWAYMREDATYRISELPAGKYEVMASGYYDFPGTTYFYTPKTLMYITLSENEEKSAVNIDLGNLVSKVDVNRVAPWAVYSNTYDTSDGSFRIHYNVTGDAGSQIESDFAEAIGRRFALAKDFETSFMSYPSAVCADPTHDYDIGRIAIYVTSPKDPKNPEYAWTISAEQTLRFFLVDSDLWNNGKDPTYEKVVAAAYHEYFHGIQTNYFTDNPLWIKEGTADWMTYEALEYDDANTALYKDKIIQLLAGHVPWFDLDLPEDKQMHMLPEKALEDRSYETLTYWIMLSRRKDGIQLVKDVLASSHTLTAIDTLLRQHQTTIENTVDEWFEKLLIGTDTSTSTTEGEAYWGPTAGEMLKRLGKIIGPPKYNLFAYDLVAPFNPSNAVHEKVTLGKYSCEYINIKPMAGISNINLIFSTWVPLASVFSVTVLGVKGASSTTIDRKLVDSGRPVHIPINDASSYDKIWIIAVLRAGVGRYRFYAPPAVMKTSIHSPARLFITDPLNHSIGINPATGQEVNEIPEAFSSDISTEEASIIIPQPVNGAYTILLVGTSNGDYRLTIEYITTDQTASQVFTGTIVQNGQRYYSTIISDTGEMSAIAWEYVFKDTKRGTMLRISTDDTYFQFTAPDKDFGIKNDPKMLVKYGVMAICYGDSQMYLTAAAVTGSYNFCTAVAYDKQTKKTYLLIGKTT